MKFKNPLLAVKDMPASIDFYKRVLGLCVIMDFGANVTLTGGVCRQTLDSWQEFLEGKPVLSGGNAGELYFEESDFEAFSEKLKKLEIEYVHAVKEHRWGQRVVCFYDPDHHPAPLPNAVWNTGKLNTAMNVNNIPAKNT